MEFYNDPFATMFEEFDLGLCDHPLYPDLVEYVRSNPGPVAKPKGKRK